MQNIRTLVDSSPILDEEEQLRLRLQRDGYLFIRGLLPADVLEDLRQQFTDVLSAVGWVRSDAPSGDPVADLSYFCVEPEPAYNTVHDQLYRIPECHGLKHRAELLDLVELLLQAPVMPHPHIINRVIFPQSEAYTTPAHQDFVPVQGSVDTLTAWIPLSDLPPEMGGLQISEGSHGRGILDFVPALGSSGTEISDPLEGTWVGGTFAQGDVLFFSSLTVHRGAPATGRHIRLSVDARYQRVRDPISPGALDPHSDLTWDDIYEGWPSKEHQYYWGNLELNQVPFDRQYFDKRDAMAFELAAEGNEMARSTLQRIVARDPDPVKKRKAAAALVKLGERMVAREG